MSSRSNGTPTGDGPESHPAPPSPSRRGRAAPGATLTVSRKGRVHSQASSAPDEDEERYTDLREIGRGGLGRVFRAHDRRLERPVAVKELHHLDASARARFFREALLTARLQHPGIVPVMDARLTEAGVPYYAMKLVDGETLKRRAQRCTSLEERLALLPAVIDVAEAVAYAHSRGIIHRDLKPSNVMVGDFGETMVVDWGLAKTIPGNAEGDVAASVPGETGTDNDRSVTSAGAVLGTPHYMPPEQARGEPVDERADVYAIGAIIYFVLSGTAPRARLSPTEVLEDAFASHPREPAALPATVPSDLRAVVEQAMAREAARRYPDAGALAEDLRAFVQGRLVSSYDYRPRDLVLRWMRRHRSLVTMAALSVLALALVGGLSVRRIVQERAAADRARAEAVAQSERLLVQRARDLLDEDPTEAAALLKTLPDDSPHATTARLLAGAAIHEGVAVAMTRASQGPVRSLALSSERRLVVIRTQDEVTSVWDVDGDTITPLPASDDLRAAVFSPDGSALYAITSAGVLRRYDVGTWHHQDVLELDAALSGLDLDDEGARVALWGANVLVLWSSSAQRVVHRSEPGEKILDVAFHPDGERFATTHTDGAVRLWTPGARSGRLLVRHEEGPPERGSMLRVPAHHAQFCEKRDEIWSVGGYAGVRVCELATGACRELPQQRGNQQLLLVGENCEQATSWSDAGTLVHWDLDRGRWSLRQWDGDRISTLARSEQGKILAAGHENGTTHVNQRGRSLMLRGHDGPVTSIAIGDDERHLVTGSADGTVRLWRLDPPPQPITRPPNSIKAIDVAGDSVAVTTGLLESGYLDVHAFDDNQLALSAVTRAHPAGVALAPDGSRVYVGGRRGSVRIVDPTTGERTEAYRHELTMHDGKLLAKPMLGAPEQIVMSPDGTWLASTKRRGAYLWKTDGSQAPVFLPIEGRLWDLDFDPASQLLVTGGADRALQIWSLPGMKTRSCAEPTCKLRDNDHRVWDTEEAPPTRLEPPADVVSVDLGATGHLAAGLVGGGTLLWHPDEGERLFGEQADTVSDVTFSPDGGALASAGLDSTLWVYQLDSGEGRRLGSLPFRAARARWSESGDYIAVSGEGGIMLFDVTSGLGIPLHRWMLAPETLSEAEKDPANELTDRHHRGRYWPNLFLGANQPTDSDARHRVDRYRHGHHPVWHGDELVIVSAMGQRSRPAFPDADLSVAEWLERMTAVRLDDRGELTSRGRPRATKAPDSSAPVRWPAGSLRPRTGDPVPKPPPEVFRDENYQAIRGIRVVADVCLDRTGTATSVTIVDGSGFPRYDRMIERWLRSRTYRPLPEQGQRACTESEVVFEENAPSHMDFRMRENRMTMTRRAELVDEADFHRVDGPPLPEPPPELTEAASQRPDDYVVGRIHVCVNDQGKPVSSDVYLSSGSEEYDRDVEKALLNSRFDPTRFKWPHKEKPEYEGHRACANLTFGEP